MRHCLSLKFFFRLLYFSKSMIALFPFRYPTIDDTEYFGTRQW